MAGEIRVINPEDVIYFSASGPYTRIFLRTGEVVWCSESIKVYSESPGKHPAFVRIHRSFYQKTMISPILHKPGNISVKMSNGDTRAVTQQRRAGIFNRCEPRPDDERTYSR